MRKRERPPRKVFVKTAKIFNPYNSPTPSPIRKVSNICYDIYQVERDEDFTVLRLDLPSLKDWDKMKNFGGQMFISTEGTEYSTPTISFIPKRPHIP